MPRSCCRDPTVSEQTKSTLVSSPPERLSVQTSCLQSVICKLAQLRVSSLCYRWLLLAPTPLRHLCFLTKFKPCSQVFLCVCVFPFIPIYSKPMNFHLSVEAHGSAAPGLPLWASTFFRVQALRFQLCIRVTFPVPEWLSSKVPAFWGTFLPPLQIPIRNP